MKKIQDWYFRPINEQMTLEQRLKARLVFNMAIGSFLIGFILSPLGLLREDGMKLASVLVNMGAVFLYVIPLYLLRTRGSYRVAAILFCLIAYVLILYNLLSFFGGGADFIVALVLIIFVLFAHFTLGRTWSLIYSVLTVLALGLSLGIQYQRHSMSGSVLDLGATTSLEITLVTLIGCMVLLQFIVGQYDQITRLLHEDLSQQNLEIRNLLDAQKRTNEILTGRETELIKAKQQAEEGARAKSQFLSTMSHEIRTPMNAVIGMADLLRESELNEEQEDYVHTIQISGENLLGIINNILDYSKIESGSLELEQKWFALDDPIEDTLELLASKATEKGLDLIYHPDPDIPTHIQSDPTWMRQILVNLMNNALKFTETGEILLSVEVKEQKEDLYMLEFSVRDTGIGIPEDKLHRLFHSFSQVDASTTRKYGGTGLGLAITKRLVDYMGGEIWVESEPGVGTTFFFTMKVPGEIRESALAEPLTEGALEGAKVLLVDDNQTNLKILTEQCNTWNLCPIGTNDPEAALTLLRETPDIRLVICDLEMPGMDGLELSQKIRETYPERSLPILMLSSLGSNWRNESMGIVDDYLNKPVKLSLLKKKIWKLLHPSTFTGRQEPQTGEEILARHLPLDILLVEDHPINQKVALKMLSKLGYEADLATNGQEAVEACNKRAYDLVFMDMQMPIMDGITATKILREHQLPDHKRPIIIAMTANAMNEDRDRCLQAGMDGFLAKPIQKETVAWKIKKWFAQPERHVTQYSGGTPREY